MIIEIDLNQTERHKNYCPYVIKNQHGEPILYLFGGIAASAAELVAKALEMDDGKFPGVREIFDRYDKQEGITREWDSASQTYKKYKNGVLTD